MKLKILQINKFHYLKGGSERYYFAVTELLEKNGHDVIHFSMTDKRNESSKYTKYFVDYIDLHKFSLKNIAKFFYNYDAIRRLKQLIKDEKPEVAHLHNIAHQLTPAIINLLKKNNIKVVQTLHDYKLICPNAKLYNKKGNCQKCLGGKYYNCFLNSCMHNSRAKSFLGMMEAYYYKNINKAYDSVDIFIAPSQFMKEISVKFGIAEQRIKVVYNFLSDKWLEENIKENNIQNKEKDKYILYFGRLSEEKGIDTVLKALDKAENKEIKFVIAGAGPYKEKIQNKINKLALFKRVSLVGFKSGQELNDLIDKAEAIVMPSLWPENMPYSLLESLAKAKIVIASKVGGMPEMIKDKQNGYLHEVGDFNSLAKIIDKLLDLDKNSVEKMSNLAKKQVFLLNSLEHYKNIKHIYNSLINK